MEDRQHLGPQNPHVAHPSLFYAAVRLTRRNKILLDESVEIPFVFCDQFTIPNSRI